MFRANRPAEGAAELVRIERRLGGGEEIPGVQRIVAIVLEHRSAEAIAAGPDREVHDGAAEHAELGGRVVGLDLEFLDRLERRRDVDERVQRLVVRDAVEHVVVPRPRHAVDAVVHEAPGAGGRGVLREVGEAARDRAGRQRDELLEQTPVQRQRLDLLVVDHLAELAGGAVDERRLGDDRDFFRHLPDLQRDVEPRGLCDLQHDAALDEPLEAFCSTAIAYSPGVSAVKV